MRHDEYLQHDATALAARVRAGDISAAELLDLALAQLDRVEPQIHALACRLDGQARAQLGAGVSGPLAGVPMLLKDGLQHVAGVPTLMGCAAARHLPLPAAHSAVTRRLLGAGAVVFGKTSLPELGLKGVSDSQLHGPVCNPWDLTRNAGGSSGGSAAAVAAGVLPMAAGNDGGGSLRIPAAWCHLFTLKPSRGLISEAPYDGEAWFGACAQGMLSRSVRDNALALDVLAGPEPGDPFIHDGVAPGGFVQAIGRPPPRLRIARWVQSPIGTPVDPAAVRAVDQAAALLRRLGHEVEDAAPAIDGSALARAYLAVYFGQVPAEMDRMRRLGARRDEFELLTRATAALGRGFGAGALTAELLRWNDFARELGAFFGRHHLLLTPTTAVPPLVHGATDLPPALAWALGLLEGSGLLTALSRTGWLDGLIEQISRDNMAPVPFTQLANLTGTPAMSLPMPFEPGALPMGAQLIGPMGADALLLQLAAQVEQAQPWFDQISPLSRSPAH